MFPKNIATILVQSTINVYNNMFITTHIYNNDRHQQLKKVLCGLLINTRQYVCFDKI